MKDKRVRIKYRLGLLYRDLKKAAASCGYLLTVSEEASDETIIAVPWYDDSKNVDTLIKRMKECVLDPKQMRRTVTTKQIFPNNRILFNIPVYDEKTISIHVIRPISDYKNIIVDIFDNGAVKNELMYSLEGKNFSVRRKTDKELILVYGPENLERYLLLNLENLKKIFYIERKELTGTPSEIMEELKHSDEETSAYISFYPNEESELVTGTRRIIYSATDTEDLQVTVNGKDYIYDKKFMALSATKKVFPFAGISI